MYKVPPTSAALPRWFWLATVIAIGISGAAGLLIIWLLDGDVGEGGRTALALLPACAINSYGSMRWLNKDLTKTERRLALIALPIMLAIVCLVILAMVLLDRAPGLAITNLTSVVIEAFSILVGSQLSKWWLIRRRKA